MAFFRLCKGEDILEVLREVFRANIVRIPQAGIRPLGLIIQKDQKTRIWGDLRDILVGNAAENLSEYRLFQMEQIPDLSGRKSRGVDFELGSEILAGFLKGFSLPAAEINTHLKGSYKYQFSFKGVDRLYVSPSALGKALLGVQIDKYNPAAKIFFGDHPARLFVIDSVIRSTNFAVHLEASQETKIKLEADKIQAVLDALKSEIKIKSESEQSIAFEGKEAMAFAFTCLQIVTDASGRIELLPVQSRLDEKDLEARGVEPDESEQEEQSFETVLLHEEPGMLSWDE
ncbi:MAG: hypothetical protein NW226_17325 [Microscillaceae bacterium]|nr:hypothetical protein [Microscillaceae bacterium]